MRGRVSLDRDGFLEAAASLELREAFGFEGEELPVFYGFRADPFDDAVVTFTARGGRSARFPPRQCAATFEGDRLVLLAFGRPLSACPEPAAAPKPRSSLVMRVFGRRDAPEAK